MEEKFPNLTIYYDGTCRTCNGIMEKLEHSSEREKFVSKDIHTSELPPSITFSAAMRDVHVVDAFGNVYVGANAAAKIISEYPRWRWLSKVLRLPGIRTVAALAYRAVADSRHLF